MTQTPAPESFLLKWRGDTLAVTLAVDPPRKGRAAFRTNLGHGDVRRREIVDETEKGLTPLAKAWTDIPLAETAPGVFTGEIPLDEVGVFSGKACFFPEGSRVPEWPEGRNLHVKVESGETRASNAIYCVFPRQFGSFREVVRRLPLIMDTMGFRIVQTLPPFPVPTTYAVMGEYGCPFAATDFLSVDPAMAEFDEAVTPLGQFEELIGAVHAKGGLFFVDLPANHTGWASTLQTHHPDWFRHEPDGRFHSPGAWGVKWADLVELDYANAELRAYMADVFLFWCREGVDGFRCDAGYMIPAETWEYIVAKVREEYPDTVFLLEGLGGEIAVTNRLLAESNLDWAYSELFQTYDRSQFEGYLPAAIERAEKYGTLVHFAETHDNDRLAKRGAAYARLRVQLAALLSWQGAWGIANGVEWYATEKIDVHGKNDLNWGAKANMVDLIARLNGLLRTHPGFAGASRLAVVTRGGGNTLAVVRTRPGCAPVLVLANLDCAAPAEIAWDAAAFPAGRVDDLLNGGRRALGATLRLAPGEVRCFAATAGCAPAARDKARATAGQEKSRRPAASAAASEANESPAAAREAGAPLFHVVIPRDVRREVVVPAGEKAEITADAPFRARLVDPASGKTLRVARSAQGRVVFDAPAYAGDGTRCRRLRLDVARYIDGRAVRTHAAFLVPPPADAARARLALSGEEVRRHPDFRTILSNGAGAAAQVRLGWGEIRSQYDALLAANPNPDVPSDRLNLWTRTRCWLQREGYTRELDRKCVTRVTVDPAGRFARWDFTAPCGMGKEAAFVFTLSLTPGANAATLAVTRVTSGGDDVGDQVRLVFRPDVEWRSFHATTKAFAGPEQLFPASARAAADGEEGFDFSPYGQVFALRVTGGAYHHEPQWTYCVGHPEEAARGQDGSGDLFSPGWISADLKVGETVLMEGRLRRNEAARHEGPERRERPEASSPSRLSCPSSQASQSLSPLADALRAALDLYIVKRDDLKTVIAGYPWFLDWGRDTFIFLRGLIAAGETDIALKILAAFAAFEENGTLPNIIYGKTAGNRDTTDAQLWFIRCVQEVEEWKSGRVEGGKGGKADEWGETLAALKKTCDSIVDNYLKGTPNGIRVDPGSGLVWSPSHFTWMDTNYPACTPRVGYPVEIQALWISALRFLGRDTLADQALDSVKRYFKRPSTPHPPSPTPHLSSPIPHLSSLTSHFSPLTSHPSSLIPPLGYYDCLAAPNGEPACAAVPEDTIRPNQLFLITLGVLDDRSILAATEELLVPGGIRSLNAENPLYRGVYAGDEDTARKPAYHNGTVWAWPFPLYAEALVATGACSREVARSLLASAVENLNAGCLGHLSENADGDAPHAQKGCTAQAWSDSEFLRVWLKLSSARAESGF
mgnify:CR=1 FL=1